MSHVIKLAIVDSYEFVRHGLKVVLGQSPDICCVSEADSAAQLLALCKEIQPDIVLFDFDAVCHRRMSQSARAATKCKMAEIGRGC